MTPLVSRSKEPALPKRPWPSTKPRLASTAPRPPTRLRRPLPMLQRPLRTRAARGLERARIISLGRHELPSRSAEALKPHHRYRPLQRLRRNNTPRKTSTCPAPHLWPNQAPSLAPPSTRNLPPHRPPQLLYPRLQGSSPTIPVPGTVASDLALHVMSVNASSAFNNSERTSTLPPLTPFMGRQHRGGESPHERGHHSALLHAPDGAQVASHKFLQQNSQPTPRRHSQSYWPASFATVW